MRCDTKVDSKAGVLGSILCAFLLVFCLPLHAQPQPKIRHIGFLSAASYASTQARIEAFRQELSALGYVDGKNVVIDWRFAEGNFQRLPALATELVRLKVDAIVVAGGEPVAFAVKQAHPGANITGVTRLTQELNGKRLELLKEVLPSVSRVVFFPSLGLRL
jgi:ABC-type uncharacterized transport system substrate-binding protein